MTLTLERTPDILAELGQLSSRAASGRPILVGFAAETRDVLARARDKRRRKGIDLIVANDVSRSDAGFDVETNAVTEIPARAKQDVASAILDHVEQLIRARASEPLRA